MSKFGAVIQKIVSQKTCFNNLQAGDKPLNFPARISEFHNVHNNLKVSDSEWLSLR